MYVGEDTCIRAVIERDVKALLVANDPGGSAVRCIDGCTAYICSWSMICRGILQIGFLAVKLSRPAGTATDSEGCNCSFAIDVADGYVVVEREAEAEPGPACKREIHVET